MKEPRRRIGPEAFVERELGGTDFEHPDFRRRDDFFAYLRQISIREDDIKMLEDHWKAVVLIRGINAEGENTEIGTGWLLINPSLAVRDGRQNRPLIAKFPLVMTNHHVYNRLRNRESSFFCLYPSKNTQMIRLWLFLDTNQMKTKESPLS